MNIKQCPNCQKDNSERAKFCTTCAAPMDPAKLPDWKQQRAEDEATRNLLANSPEHQEKVLERLKKFFAENPDYKSGMAICSED